MSGLLCLELRLAALQCRDGPFLKTPVREANAGVRIGDAAGVFELESSKYRLVAALAVSRRQMTSQWSTLLTRWRC